MARRAADISVSACSKPGRGGISKRAIVSCVTDRERARESEREQRMPHGLYTIARQLRASVKRAPTSGRRGRVPLLAVRLRFCAASRSGVGARAGMCPGRAERAAKRAKHIRNACNKNSFSLHRTRVLVPLQTPPEKSRERAPVCRYFSFSWAAAAATMGCGASTAKKPSEAYEKGPESTAHATSGGRIMPMAPNRRSPRLVARSARSRARSGRATRTQKLERLCLSSSIRYLRKKA